VGQPAGWVQTNRQANTAAASAEIASTTSVTLDAFRIGRIRQR
jgi:hypothetical protein